MGCRHRPGERGLCDQFSLRSVQQHYTFVSVIRSFAHEGLAAFYETGRKAGIQAAHAARLRRQLGQLDQASSPADMNVYGWRLHPLKGDRAGHWAVWVNGNWRMTFNFDGTDASVVDYQDYH